MNDPTNTNSSPMTPPVVAAGVPAATPAVVVAALVVPAKEPTWEEKRRAWKKARAEALGDTARAQVKK